MAAAQSSVRISYTGSITRDGPHLVPHDMAFPSAMVSLRVLMGAEHRTHELSAHGRTWRSDEDYFMHIGLSGEGFRFLFDTAEYFRFAEPEGAEPLLDCLGFEGLPAKVYAAKPVRGIEGVWQDEAHLVKLVTDTLRKGFPALILGRTGNDWVLLATGYEQDGSTLVGWMFVPGADMSNKSFSIEDCQYIKDWAKGADAAVLITGAKETLIDKNAIIRRALTRAKHFLFCSHGHPHSDGCNFYDAWLNAIHTDASFLAPFTARPHIDPDIWDLAERRAFAAGFMEQAGEILSTKAFDPACDALHQIHDLMWKINSLCEGEDARKKLLDPAVRREIVSILNTCRELDQRVAGIIGEVLGV